MKVKFFKISLTTIFLGVAGVMGVTQGNVKANTSYTSYYTYYTETPYFIEYSPIINNNTYSDNVQAKITNTESISDNQQIILDEINKDRVANGIHPLNFDENLNNTAMYWSQEQANENLMSHNDFNNRSDNDNFMAENVACGSGIVSAETFAEMWRNSAPHYHNYMNPNYNYIGIGIVYNTDINGNIYYTYATEQFR